MDYYSFIGMLVVGIGVIVALFFAVHTPLSKIVERLTKIETKLENIDETLKGHSNKLDEHEKRIGKNEQDISILKKTKKGSY